ncbi:MAG TPA: hypothetical protein VN256_02005 [Pyrinomonadaceae bacterium]|nr:hypothetical protein [Pyrinomonadaceae bacterium]
MRSRRPYVASILAAALLLASLSVGSTAERKAGQQSGPAALFVVYGTQPANAYMVPFVIVEGGQFKQPIAGDSDADEITRFTDAYYSRGKKYRVLFGGGEAGSLTVKKSNKDEECTRTSADVALQSTAKLNRNVMALATDSASFGGARSTRRSPTAAERAALMPLVRAAFKEKGTPAALLPSLATVNLTALDLDGDGKAELVGSFVARKTGRGAARYPLFLFAEPQGNSYRTTVLQYERFTSKDIMSGADLTAIENGVYIERLVDALDLDGDGALEVVTQRDGLEGDGYYIYKKQGGTWKQVYEFANYRCGF